MTGSMTGSHWYCTNCLCLGWGEYIHQRGLKFGTYGDIGYKTCQGLTGFHDHFEEDAQTLADWKVDYIKVDGCNENQEESKGFNGFQWVSIGFNWFQWVSGAKSEGNKMCWKQDMARDYPAFGAALNKTGRPIAGCSGRHLPTCTS